MNMERQRVDRTMIVVLRDARQLNVPIQSCSFYTRGALFPINQ
jgi:hypothetical protein